MKIRKTIENLQYIVLALLILGQCLVGSNFFTGQIIYLIANLISVSRSFLLHRPISDKVKDTCCLAITAGLILIKIFGIKS